MAGSHIGLNFNLEDLKGEQVDIDKLIDSLLSSSNSTGSSSVPSSPVILSQQRRNSEASTTPVPVKSRGPGRPRSTKSAVSNTVTAPAPVSKQPKLPAQILPEDSPLSAVIECLNKISLQNKKLLNIVESIVEKVDSNSDLNKKFPVLVSDPVEAPAASGALQSVNSRLEKLEQNANQNTLVCRGTAVESLIKESEVAGKPNLERLKVDLYKSVCGEGANNIPEVKVSLFGRAKKVIKVECPNLATKVHIIKKAREKKPKGLYVNEFLTESKLKLFLNARSLKKLHSNKIKAVFTRGGTVCYSLVNQERFHQLNTISELRSVLGLGDPSEERAV